MSERQRWWWWVGDMKQTFLVFYVLSISLWSSINTYHESLFWGENPSEGEGKQSSNATNVIMVRSERRSFHSPRFKNTVAPRAPQATPYIWQPNGRRRGVWNPKSTEQLGQHVLFWIKKKAASYKQLYGYGICFIYVLYSKPRVIFFQSPKGYVRRLQVTKAIIKGVLKNVETHRK